MHEPLPYRPAVEPLPTAPPPGYVPAYDHTGHPVGYVPQPPAQVVVQMPQTGMSQAQRDLIVTVVLILAVVVVCTAAVCAVIVVAGGTLMGVIGTVSASLPAVGLTLVGAIVAAGWAVSKLKAATRRDG